MTAIETAESLIYDARMQGFDRKTAIKVVAFAVDKIINKTGIPLSECSEWIEVMEQLEFMV